jgi:hypothetical protein
MMRLNDQPAKGLDDHQIDFNGTVTDLFDETDALEESPISMAQNDVDEDSFQVAVQLENVRDSSLIAELKSRGYVITDLDTLDKLHDAYWTDPNADALVRVWIRKATGRP